MSLLKLKFIVVGASVAGLTCASALAKSGHDVLVLEMNDRLEEVIPTLSSHFPNSRLNGRPKTDRDGGLRVPPNMARLLIHGYPGMAQFFEERGSRCSGCVD